MLTLEGMVAYRVLAALEGLLVALPRPATSAMWGRIRSPGWALVLPGSLLVGTFGVLAVPASATGLGLVAALSTPVLALAAALGVARGRRAAWLLLLPALCLATIAQGWWGDLATSALAGLGCLTLGAALVRLTPLRWLGVGIVAMCVVDVVLLSTGVGQPAAELLKAAMAQSPLPDFHRAQLGPITKDYPDLFLAALLGSALAGHRLQRLAAVLVAVLASASYLLFMVADMLPATLPLGVAAACVAVLHRYGGSRPRPSGQRRPAIAVPVAAH